MKKLFAILLTMLVLLSCTLPCFATESESADVFAKYEDGERTEIPVSEDRVNVTLPDKTDVVVEQIPESAAKLVIYSVPASEQEAWAWVTACFASDGTPVHTFDIYFESADGKRTNADGAVVTIDCAHCEGVMTVCSLTTDGRIRVLGTADASADALSFITDGSNYYVMMIRTAAPNDENRVIVNGNPGGDVDISEKNPATGETVTVITKPDEGKIVDKITVIDGDGNEITVRDNGDGSYSFEQPAGDVTINVTYKDKIEEGAKTGYLWLWLIVVILAAAVVIFLIVRKKKQQEK